MRRLSGGPWVTPTVEFSDPSLKCTEMHPKYLKKRNFLLLILPAAPAVPAGFDPFRDQIHVDLAGDDHAAVALVGDLGGGTGAAFAPGLLAHVHFQQRLHRKKMLQDQEFF